MVHEVIYAVSVFPFFIIIISNFVYFFSCFFQLLLGQGVEHVWLDCARVGKVALSQACGCTLRPSEQMMAS